MLFGGECTIVQTSLRWFFEGHARFFGGKYRRNLIATFAVLFFFIYTNFWRNRHFSFEETAVVTGSLVQNIIWVRKSEIYTKRVFVPVKKENQLFSCGEFLWLCTDGSFWCFRVWLTYFCDVRRQISKKVLRQVGSPCHCAPGFFQQAIENHFTTH